VAAPVTFGQAYIAPVLAGYLEEYPKVDISLTLKDGHIDFFADRVDVAFRVGDFTNLQKGVEPIAPIERILVASPEYLNNYGMPETPSDLEYHLCLIHSVISPNNTWTFYKAGNKEVIKVDGKVYSNNFIPLREASIGGKGIALLATITVIEELKSRRLIQVLRNWQVAPANVFATYPPFDYIPPKSSTFVQYIKENFLQLDTIESV
jgi:DNA-binding transcriptional LysR family regulator